MQADDPPYLSVGTAVSAKYKGAFCEAKVSNATHVVKCKVTFKMGLGSATVSDEYIRGTLRVGQLVQARHPDKKEYLDATITKIQDCSQYTVVFDDGDITTLRRTALCLKSGRHFNESETLDQLPLTHPEHFGNPVVGGRRGRRNRQLKEDDSEEEAEERNEPDLIGYSADVGRVVVIETSEKKRSKDTWFPALVVIPSAQPTVRINMKDEYLVRSFKDGRYYTVPKKEVTEFKREIAEKVENSLLADAVERTLRYIDRQELPDHWDRSTLFNLQTVDSDFDENATDSDDDEQSEEKDLFVAQLYKFMEDSRTPLNTSPVIAKRDVDLQRLFRLVEGLGGFKSVSNQNKWKTVASKLKLPNNASTANQVQNVYKVYLLSFEGFYRTLGVTMHVNTRSTKKKGGRSLIRDKDRSTPINSPRPDKDEETEREPREVKREEKEKKEVIEEKPKRKSEVKREEERKKDLDEKIEVIEVEVASTSTSTGTGPGTGTVGTSTVVESGRPKRNKSEPSKERKSKIIVTSGKIKEESADESGEKEEEKIQQTRSKSQLSKTSTKEPKEAPAPKEPVAEKKPRETKPPVREVQSVVAKPVAAAKVVKKVGEDEKKRSSVRKRLAVDEKPPVAESPTSSAAAETAPAMPVNKGDKLMVYYGPYESESKITYEAKVLEIDSESGDRPSYLVHYTGWNTRYDEWITVNRIAENVTAKVKAYKQGGTTITSATPNLKGKNVIRRGRGMSFSGKTTSSDAPRSTTPSSITSSSSRTKSPATPVTRSSNRVPVRQDSLKRIRRGSSQTEASNHSDSDSDASESEVETMRTRSTSKADQEVDVVRSSKRRAVKTLSVKLEKRRIEGESEKDEEPEKTLKRRRVVRKYEDKGGEFDTKRGRPPLKKSEDEEDTEKDEDDFEQLKKSRPSKKSPDPDKKKEQLESPKFFKKMAKYDEEDTESVDSKTSKPFSDSEKEETVVVVKLKSSPEKSTEESEEDEDSVNPPKGREFDLNQIRLELKGLPVKVLPDKESIVPSSDGDDSTQASESAAKEETTAEEIEEELEFNTEKGDKSPNSDIYEFKEPEPFELETRKFVEDKKRVVAPRIIEDMDKKKGSKSPLKQEPGCPGPGPGSAEKKKRAPFKSKLLDETDEDSDKIDAFDKLVVSPSYNVVKTLTPEQLVQQQKAVEKILEEPLFTELPESMDAITGNQQQIFTREDGLFSDAYLKSSPGRNMDLDFDRPEENKSEDSDKEDSLRESIQRVIAAQTSTDDDSNDDLHVMPPLSSYQGKKKEDARASASIDLFDDVVEKESPLPPEEIEKDEKPKYISPALQETDSSLLESMVAQPLVINREDIKEINVKTGVTKITDSILQKINSFKNKGESRSPKREEPFDFKKESPAEKVKEDLKIKPTMSSKIVDVRKTELEKPKEVKLPIKCLKSAGQPELSPLANLITSLEKNIQPATVSTVTVSVAQNVTFTNVVSTVCATPSPVPVTKPTSKSPVASSEGKKRKKVISRAYVEDSDIDSSDSEQLVIAKSDDESRAGVETKEVSSASVSLAPELTTDDDDESQSQEGDDRFKFDDDVKPDAPDQRIEPDCGKEEDEEEEEEEEPDPNLHSLLLCEETIPRSPVPAIEATGTPSEGRSGGKEGKSVLEMPFASAPGTSNNAVAACSKSVAVFGEPGKAAAPKPQQPSPPLLMALQQPRPDNRSSAMQDTPPTTPESSVSLSPHGENGFMSPNIVDNDSCKSNEGESDFVRQRRNSSNKVSPYSEEDTQMTGESSSTKKQADPPTRKRRKSSRSDDAVPVKRGRKPMNRSRHNSDSDDTSEHSTSGSTNINATASYVRSSQSPRPAKYNFVVEFDPSVDSSQRIAVLQQKLSELRKAYADVKSELATVERRRKKLRRREREAKATKQEATPT